MYDCNEFNNLAGILMALPAPITALINSEQVQSTLFVGFDVLPPEAATVTPDQLLEDSFQQRVELVAIGADALNDVDHRNALIAKCRDQLSQKVVLELPQELQQKDQDGMTETDCLALGFIRCAVTESNRYYLFDLKTYKPVPDWLNPKFWANPQNWDKYRW
ncbi:MAG: hypothetical protein CMK89_16400 [Pseudomonadales bacterium]|nr:hypothetical protein [Pseudomonadales bacterium]RLU02264.1 MAG: hypothetical protein D9N11_10095 [Ketobacter sp.]